MKGNIEHVLATCKHSKYSRCYSHKRQAQSQGDFKDNSGGSA
jgi:hypothetical protein